MDWCAAQQQTSTFRWQNFDWFYRKFTSETNEPSLPF